MVQTRSQRQEESPFEVAVPLISRTASVPDTPIETRYQVFYEALERALFFFALGSVVYVFAWMPVVYRIVEGVVNHPDRMPIPVWVSVLGILFFYELFIFAQCSSVTRRVCVAFSDFVERSSGQREGLNTRVGALYEELHRPWSMMIFWLLSFPDWKVIALIAFGVTTDLTSAVVLVIPAVREGLFDNTNDQSRAEPYAMMAMLLAIWLLSPVLLYVLSKWKAFYLMSDCHKWLLIITLPEALGAAVFFGWGNLVGTDFVASKTVWPWLLINMGLVVLLLTLLVAQASRALGRDPPESMQPKGDAKTLSKADILDSTATLRRAHWVAGFTHLLLAGFSLFIGEFRDQDSWWADWVLLKDDLFLMQGDWNMVSLVSDNETLKAMIPPSTRYPDMLRLDYCASSTAMPLMLVLLSVGWSAASAAQHFYSANCLDKTATRAPKERAYNPHHGWMPLLVLTLLVGLALALLVTDNFHAKWWVVCTLVILFAMLVLPALWVTAFGVYHNQPMSALLSEFAGRGDKGEVVEQSKEQLAWVVFQRLRSTRRYKWIEYTFSATAMHAVVLYIGGVKGAHEHILACALLATSMVFPNMMDTQLDRMEDTLATTDLNAAYNPVRLLEDALNTEKPFIFLSFFSKTILSVALTLPMVFIDRGTYRIEPAPCLSESF